MWYMYILIALIVIMAFMATFLSRIRKIGERGSLQLGKAAIALMESFDALQGLTRAIAFQNDRVEAKTLRDKLAPFEPEKMDLATQSIQQSLTDFQGYYQQAMELKPTAKRTGDLTHYEKKLEEHVLELQEAVRIYNKTVRLYTTRSQESPYNFIGKIIPIRPMASMEMEKLIQTEAEIEPLLDEEAKTAAKEAKQENPVESSPHDAHGQ